jgi:hypothetical protein
MNSRRLYLREMKNKTMSNQFFEHNNEAEKAFIEAMKKEFKAENLQPSPEVKANLKAAFRAKNTPSIVGTLNRSIPIWQVAASLLLVLTAIYWFRPFEKTVIAEAETIIETKPIIKTEKVIQEKIVYQIDTIFIEKPVIQYVEIPSTTKTIIDKPMDNSKPMASLPMLDKQQKKLNINELQLNFEVLDNFYDTALVRTIEGQNRGQSMSDMNYETFDSLVLN